MRSIAISLCFVLMQFGSAGEARPPGEEASLGCRQSIALSKTLEVHEGLPHQTKDRDLFEREMKRGDIRKIWNHPFYTPGVLATNADELKRVLSDPETIRIREGNKRCGGFHPDYCVEWKTEKKTCHALICFGCAEIVFLDGNASFIYDLSAAAGERLRKLLSGYARKRPSGVGKQQPAEANGRSRG